MEGNSQLSSEQFDKKTKYKALLPQIKAVIENESNLIANLANISSILHLNLGSYWTGFYIPNNDELVLGPFQGPVACTRIKFGKGVCGTSWKEKETLIVQDVHNFPGHIACSVKSRSEIVVPAIENNQLSFLLDIDSENYSFFDLIDKIYLEKTISLILESKSK